MQFYQLIFSSPTDSACWFDSALDTRLGFSGGSAGEESACNVGDLGSIPELGRSPGEGKGYPLQYSGLEKSMENSYIVHGGLKESDITERLSLDTRPCLEGQVQGFQTPLKRGLLQPPLPWAFLFLFLPQPSVASSVLHQVCSPNIVHPGQQMTDNRF